MRPDFTLAVENLLHEVCNHVERFSEIKTEAILVVMGAAWGKNVASIRSFSGCASEVKIAGERRHIELMLRPLFFLQGNVQTRLQILLHELLHLDPENPVFLDEKMRHVRTSQQDVNLEAAALARKLLQELDATFFSPLGFHGEMNVRAFKMRPILETQHQAFLDEHVFNAPCLMLTDPAFRTGWW